jgi:hypothetical protein
MYKQSFGKNQQIQFANEHEYYKFLGFLAKSDGSTSLVLEHNEEQGAWGSENRIQIYISNLPTGMGKLSLSAGVGNIINRLNCNEFIQNLVENHNFIMGKHQNRQDILDTIPNAFREDFDRGYNA